MIEGERTVEQLQLERADTIVMLRNLCAEYGDNDWKDNLHLSDIIEKHLMRHLLPNDTALREALERAKSRLASIGMMHSIDSGPDVQLSRCLSEGQQGYIEARAALKQGAT